MKTIMKIVGSCSKRMQLIKLLVTQTAPIVDRTYLYALLQHSSPFHDEIPTHTGRPDVLSGPDVAEDV